MSWNGRPLGADQVVTYDAEVPRRNAFRGSRRMARSPSMWRPPGTVWAAAAFGAEVGAPSPPTVFAQFF